MARTKYYYYIFSNGTQKFMTAAEALEYCNMNQVSIKRDGALIHANAPRIGLKHDSFKAGWNPGLGQYVKDKAHHRQLLKEKGLIEVGNEKLKQSTRKDVNKGFSEDLIKEACQMGADISGNEVTALLQGKEISH